MPPPLVQRNASRLPDASGPSAVADDDRAVGADGVSGAFEIAAGKVAQPDHAAAARPAEGFLTGAKSAEADNRRAIIADGVGYAAEPSAGQVAQGREAGGGKGAARRLMCTVGSPEKQNVLIASVRLREGRPVPQIRPGGIGLLP